MLHPFALIFFYNQGKKSKRGGGNVIKTVTGKGFRFL